MTRLDCYSERKYIFKSTSICVLYVHYLCIIYAGIDFDLIEIHGFVVCWSIIWDDTECGRMFR